VIEKSDGLVGIEPTTSSLRTTASAELLLLLRWRLVLSRQKVFRPLSSRIRFRFGPSNEGLFVAKSHHGIDFGGAPRGNVAASQRNQRQKHRHTAEGSWICRGYSKEKIRDQARENK
jgi:hypothetical protein